MRDEGTWVDFKGFRIWIYGAYEMSRTEILKEANEILKSGWMKKNEWISEILKNKK